MLFRTTVFFAVAEFSRLSVMGTTVAGHFNPVKTDRKLPMVYLKFTHDGRKDVFPVLFDTGSPYVLLLEDNGPVPSYAWGPKYLEVGAATVQPFKSYQTYGPPDCPQSVETTGIIKERASLIGRVGGDFNFDVDLYLTSHIDQVELMGSGILGGSFVSDFAKSTERFAIIGGVSGGSIMINPSIDEISSTHCLEPLSFASNKSPTHWVVRGSNRCGDLSIDSTFSIDTGATSIAVPREVIEEAKEALERTGATFLYYSWSPVFENCNDISGLQDIVFRLGDIKVSIKASEYVAFGEQDGQRFCYLSLREDVSGNDGSIVVGMPVLSKLVTLFDRSNNRVGFCKRKIEPHESSIPEELSLFEQFNSVKKEAVDQGHRIVVSPEDPARIKDDTERSTEEDIMKGYIRQIRGLIAPNRVDVRTLPVISFEELQAEIERAREEAEDGGNHYSVQDADAEGFGPIPAREKI